jgi:hypothetical protein
LQRRAGLQKNRKVMFCGHLERYFSRAGASKSSWSGAIASSGDETSANLVSNHADSVSEVGPILLGSSSESNASCEEIRMYPANDPRYVHPPRSVAKRSSETRDSMCNQPCKCSRRANPAAKLITPEHLGVPKHLVVIDLSFPQLNSPAILLESDTTPCAMTDLSQEECDLDVLEWIEAQKTKKVSYETM